ncbi:MAG: hypothetical protein JOZ44_04950 [Acidobacteria bacterium]|nr:hypothetical protein [Acidobacteriota bacterium]
MSLRTSLALLVAVLCPALMHAQAIPRAQLDTLADDHKISLPEAVLGHPAIFNIGFSREGGDSSRRWTPALKKQVEGMNVSIYAVAVLQDAPRLARGMIRHGIRSGIPKDEDRNFLLVYQGENEWKSFAGFSAANDAYIVLVDSAGVARARVHGKSPDAASLSTLREALSATGAKQQP